MPLVRISRLIVPVALASKIQMLATEYNSALVLVESNNFGNVVLNELRHLGYYNIWQQDGKDWLTTSRSKTEMFEGLKEVIQSGYITWLDMITYQELRALQLTDKGGIELPENMDSHADSALAMALSYVCLKKVNLKVKPYLPNWVGARRADKVLQTTGAAIGLKRRY